MLGPSVRGGTHAFRTAFGHLRRSIVPINRHIKFNSTMSTSETEVKLNNLLTSIDTDAYDSQLQAKQSEVQANFAEFNPPQIEVFRSRPEHYRMR